MEQLHVHTDNDKKLFSRPLIIGASISAGYGTKDGGPGSVLARMINPHTKITNLAFNGATSLQSIGGRDLLTYDPSIVLGFDLFFWDAVREQTGKKFETHTRKLVETFSDRNIPMIIGKLPILDLPFAGSRAFGIKKSAEFINGLLEKICSNKPNILLYDPLECLMNMDSAEFFSDGLHLTPEGNKFCAVFLARTGAYKSLKCRPEQETA